MQFCPDVASSSTTTLAPQAISSYGCPVVPWSLLPNPTMLTIPDGPWSHKKKEHKVRYTSEDEYWDDSPSENSNSSSPPPPYQDYDEFQPQVLMISHDNTTSSSQVTMDASKCLQAPSPATVIACQALPGLQGIHGAVRSFQSAEESLPAPYANSMLLLSDVPMPTSQLGSKRLQTSPQEVKGAVHKKCRKYHGSPKEISHCCVHHEECLPHRHVQQERYDEMEGDETDTIENTETTENTNTDDLDNTDNENTPLMQLCQPALENLHYPREEHYDEQEWVLTTQLTETIKPIDRTSRGYTF